MFDAITRKFQNPVTYELPNAEQSHPEMEPAPQHRTSSHVPPTMSAKAPNLRPGTCKHCGKTILWATNVNGREVPLNTQSQTRGKWLWRFTDEGKLSQWHKNTGEGFTRHVCRIPS